MNPIDHPRKVSQELSIQHVGAETLIYDESRHLAFCLNRVSSAVWNRCDGVRSVPEIAAELSAEFGKPVSEEIVLLALHQLEKDQLIEPRSDTPVSPELLDLASRRQLLIKLGYGAALMVPFIAIIAAPKAAQAYFGSVY
jgi:hypothetical protein